MPTIKDVARLAGVSISTVSYALSGKRPIADSTKKKVEDAVRTLNFHPKAGAKMLASMRTNIIALSAPMHDATEPFAFMTFILAIVTAARKQGYDVVLLTEAGQEAESNIKRVVKTNLVDGVLAMDVTADDSRVEILKELDIPSVFLGLPDQRQGLACVDLDIEAATRLAIDQLVQNGHRNIALVGHTQALYEMKKNFAVRSRAEFSSYTRQLGVDAAFISSDVDSLTREITRKLPHCTAVILDCAAIKAQEFLREITERWTQGTPLPFSVITLASSYDTDSMDPPLDSVPLEPARSGHAAVELLVNQIEFEQKEVISLCPPRYVRRGSVIAQNGGSTE